MEDLQALLDHSITEASPFLRASFEMPAHSLSAAAFHVPTVAESARGRHLARRPAASLTYFEGTDVALIAHGQMRVIGQDDSAFADIDREWRKGGLESPTEWSGSPVYLRMEPATLYTYARFPERIGVG